MKPTARQQVPAPVVHSATTAQAQAQLQQMGAASPTPQPASMTIGSDGSIELVEPLIELRYAIFVCRSDKTNAARISPKRARIVGSALIIDELGLILPFAEVIIRTKEALALAANAA